MIGFRSPPELTERIDTYARNSGVPRSKAIRKLVEKALDAKL